MFCFCTSATFCSDFKAIIPERIQALRGSCVFIPCTFNLSETYAEQLKRPTRGVWIQKVPQFANTEATVVFNDSGTSPSGQLIGDLVQKNCTTVLHKITVSDKYYFRIETAADLWATFRNESVYIHFTGTLVNGEFDCTACDFKILCTRIIDRQ